MHNTISSLLELVSKRCESHPTLQSVLPNPIIVGLKAVTGKRDDLTKWLS